MAWIIRGSLCLSESTFFGFDSHMAVVANHNPRHLNSQYVLLYYLRNLCPIIGLCAGWHHFHVLGRKLVPICFLSDDIQWSQIIVIFRCVYYAVWLWIFWENLKWRDGDSGRHCSCRINKYSVSLNVPVGVCASEVATLKR